MINKTKSIFIRATEAERDSIKKMAKKRRQSVSSYVLSLHDSFPAGTGTKRKEKGE